jgi:hypothetical protein
MPGLVKNSWKINFKMSKQLVERTRVFMPCPLGYDCPLDNRVDVHFVANVAC